MDALVSNVDVLGATQKSVKKVTTSKASMEKAAKDFEAVFMSQMLKPMWTDVETDSMFGGGPGEDVMRDMMVQEYGKSMVRNDQFGLSPAIMDAMIRMQEQADNISQTKGHV